MPRKPSPEDVIDLLLRWQRAEVTERDVHHRAESWWGDFPDDVDVPEWDPRYPLIRVLGLLETLNQELVTASDIPTLVRFLREAPRNPEQELERFEIYWESIDWSRRRKELEGHPHYAVPKGKP